LSIVLTRSDLIEWLIRDLLGGETLQDLNNFFMILFKILFLLFVLIILIRLGRRLKNQQIRITNFLIWLFFWLIAGTIVIYPESTNYLARLLGVGRGADVIVYFSLAAIFYFIFYFSVRLHIMDGRIVKIVRSISLKDEKDEN